MSDWLYTKERLALRAQCLSILLHTFGWDLDKDGLPLHSMKDLHNCAHDWVSQGHPTSRGIDQYFISNYQRVKSA